ncbi:BTB domain-containing protein [Mycena venus]|uniref:BTB domain-containing protein n=1 Tax=Mycena venus TaxID=2733690 RepID=A0A8H6YYJ2_9AGAR|nr:BTB domain-containing protein [Mycena venus]
MDSNLSPSEDPVTDGQLEMTPRPTRAEGLWFDDCGLIIQAETTIFRVSSAMLGIQSPVFRDMLSLPAPKDADTLDGCPFVFLPDTAADVAYFLRALFYYNFFEPFPASTTLPILSSVLRMSHKYEVDALRKRALTHLSHAYPIKLDEWDRLPRSLPSWFREPAKEDRDMVVAKVARQSSFETTIITGGYLSNADIINCLKGLRYLETTGAADVLDFLWGPYDCADSVDCNTSRHHMHREGEKRKNYDPEKISVMPLELWQGVDWGYLDVCDDCLPAMTAAHEAARQKLWDGLPKIFGLPDWSKLEEMKAEALK